MTDRYDAVHKFDVLAGPGDARPTALNIIEDNNLSGKWTDKVVLVTGTSSGIGIPTVAALKATGAKVYATARNIDKGRKALADILESGRVELLHLDTGNLASVRKCAQDFLSKEKKLNILINNAGVMAIENRRVTKDGFEEQFAVNYLGHFLLFLLLRPALLAAATPQLGSRVVNISSSGHRQSNVDLDNLNFEKPDSYNQWVAYGSSKTAMILMANEIERRYGSQGLNGLSINPGGIETGLTVHIPEVAQSWFTNPDVVRLMKSVEQGAATTLVGAVDLDTKGKGGVYLDDCAVQEVTDSKELGGGGVASYALDEGMAQKLWEKAVSMVGFEETASK
jgi:NAD(P)-dependent dehydrogenase (short-subunit alcohol dehydrogenase family)